MTRLEGTRAVVTGAGRDFGRSLAIRLAAEGAEVFVSARSRAAAERTRAEISSHGTDRVHAFGCDLRDQGSIRDFATAVGDLADRVDILVNNGARWLEGADLEAADDDDIVESITSCAVGTVLVVNHFLPLLRISLRPDLIKSFHFEPA